jgi:hypothetical protein
VKARYGAQTNAAVAVGTSRTGILGVLSGSAFGIDLQRAGISFDGVSVTQVPVLVELCYCTFATNPPGTNSTSVTPVQEGGRVIAHGTTAARNWSNANLPTVLTVLDEMYIHAQSGIWIPFPFGGSWDSDVSDGFVICATAPAAVNARAAMDWERL